MTNTQMIERAFRLAGILADGIPLSSEQGADGLAHMNNMLAEWKEDGIDIAYFVQTLVADDFPGYDDTVGVVEYNLALRLCGANAVEPSLLVVREADRGYARLLNDAVHSQMTEADLSHVPGSYHRSRILTDS